LIVVKRLRVFFPYRVALEMRLCKGATGIKKMDFFISLLRGALGGNSGVASIMK
jgi:hypothetical protein